MILSFSRPCVDLSSGCQAEHHGSLSPLVRPLSIKPAEPRAALPLLSSRGAGWKNVVVEEYCHDAPGEVELSPTPYHNLTCWLGKPFPLVHERGGQVVYEGLTTPNAFCLSAAGDSHYIRWQETSHVLRVHLDTQFVAKIEALHEDTQNGEVESRFGYSDAASLHIVLALKGELESGCLGGPLYAESLATALTLRLLSHPTVAEPARRTQPKQLSKVDLNRTCEYIQSNLDAALALTDIAAQVHLSPYHFTRRFKQSTGLAPHQYVIARRVERAKSLLMVGDLSVGEIAYAVGFGSPAHLTFPFKRLVGITPSRFVRDKRGS